jgi:hypothetical protein
MVSTIPALVEAIAIHIMNGRRSLT